MIDEKGLVIKTIAAVHDDTNKDREMTFEESFAYIVRGVISRTVRGRVFVTFVGNDFQASIKCGDDVWRINIDGLMSKIVAGELDSEGIGAIVIGRYKDYIYKKTNKKYFKFVDKK